MVVTRAVDRTTGLVEPLVAAGATPVLLPCIAFAPPADDRPLEQAVRHLDRYEWVVFTSATAIPPFLRAAGPRDVSKVRFAAVGPATHDALQSSGIEVEAVPERAEGEAIATALGGRIGRVLLVQAEEPSGRAREALGAAGFEVDTVVAYRTVAGSPAPEVVEQVRSGGFDAVTFASGSAARNFTELVGRPQALGLDGSSDRKVVVIGPTTAEAARNAGFTVDAVAATHSDAGLMAALATIYP